MWNIMIKCGLIVERHDDSNHIRNVKNKQIKKI